MISVFAPTAEDFSTIGLATLQPTECIVEEKAGGLFELSMKHPIDDGLKWTYLQNGCILKVPCAMREAPIVRILDAVPSGKTETKTRKIYKVSTPQGGRLHLRAKASTSSKILHAYKPGTKVVQLKTSGSWSKVAVCKGGATGWMWTAYLAFVKNETETVSGSVEKQSVIIGTQQTREQLFRIYSVAPSAETGLVEVKASHIFYDLSGVVCTKDYEPENVAAETVLNTLLANLSAEHDFEFHCSIQTKISGTYTGVSLVKALLDPEIGIVPQTNARIIRDNFDVYIIADETTERGMEIRHRKNLLGATLTTDVSSVVTRIRPVGKDKDGKRLLITDNGGWVESPNKALYPTQRDAEVEYDVSVSTAKDAEYKTNAAARTKLKELAKADFANGADAATVSLDVQFAALENTREYADYASMLTLFLYDTVKVIASYAGISAKLRVSGYTYNCLLKRYDEIQCGELTDVEQTVYGYEIASGSVSGTKLLPNSVNANAVMRNATIGYAKIAQATIEQLCADSIVAIRAHINELVAGSVTTDQLYADLAVIASAQITAANIEKANIDWANIATLTTQIATIAKAQITTANIKDANIQWAEIADLTAKMAEIAQAKIDDAEITTAQIKDLEATIATIAAAKIASADIGFAQIKDLTAGTAIITEGVGGKLYISRLAVTEANMVSLTVGELIVKGSDGSFYAVSVDEDGNVKTTLKQIANADVKDLSINAGEKIIEGSVTAACLNAQEIFADSAIIRQLIAANLDVATLFAQEAFISHLNTADISGNEYLKLAVKDAVDGIEVGGRNLALDSAVEKSSAKTSDESQLFPYWTLSDYGQTVLGEIGTEFTISFEAKASADGAAFYACLRKESDSALFSSEGAAFNLSTSYQRYSAALKTYAAETARFWPAMRDNVAAGTTYWVRNVKVEKGNVATDWTPAPEDSESELGALETRVSEAETKITSDAIVSTVTSSESYKSLSNTASTAQSKADANESSITALTKRVSAAEMKITPDAITATVKENIELGGRNYILNSRETFEAQGAETELATVKIGDTASKETALSLFGETVTVSFDWEHTVTAGTATLMFNYKYNGVKAFTADVAATGHYENTFQLEAIDTPPDWANANILYVYGTFTGTVKIRNLKLEKGSVATDWSPAPEDAADAVFVDSSYSKVEINKDKVRIVSTQMEVAVPSEDGEDDVMRVDKDGVHAEVVESDEIISDSVVHTQGDASYTPADAGALAEILEELSGKYLTGKVSIDCRNITSGTFEISGLSGPGELWLTAGTTDSATMNGVTVSNCTCPVYFYTLTFSTAGTGAVIDNSERVYFSNCAFNAGVGVQLGVNWRARARMNVCWGTCTKLAKLMYNSELDLSGSKPTGTLDLQSGSQVYNATSDPTFTAPSSGEVPTTQVATVSLSPTSTSTSGHSGLGSKLYQGRYSSSQSFRKGIMLFTLPTDLTSADDIESATLTLKRIAGVGGGGSVTAQIRCYDATGTLYASKSVQNGQTVSIDVTSAVKAMKTSGYTGLMLYNPDTTTVGSKTYTTGYARFAGKGESGAPVLKVSYRK